jgi:hypothetical protein
MYFKFYLKFPLLYIPRLGANATPSPTHITALIMIAICVLHVDTSI